MHNVQLFPYGFVSGWNGKQKLPKTAIVFDAAQHKEAVSWILLAGVATEIYYNT